MPGTGIGSLPLHSVGQSKLQARHRFRWRGGRLYFLVEGCCCSVAQLCPTLCNPMDCSLPGLRVPHHLLEFDQVHHLILCFPFCFCLQSFPASGSFPMNQLFTSDSQTIRASASVLSMNIQDWFPKDWLVWPPCSPRDSQASFLIPQFKRINSSALSLLYDPALISVRDYWKNRNFD